MTSPYMSFTLPVVGPNGTLGPEWATYLNTALSILDSHDHTSGQGRAITPSALNINSTLFMNNNQLSEIASLALESLTAKPTTANVIYDYDGDLYFNDKSANQIRLTEGGTINVAAVGTITGDYGGANPANVSFSALTQTYLFTQSSGVTGDIACGPVSIYQNTSGSYYAKIKQNAAQAGNLEWTLPVSYPASKLPLKTSSAGVMEASQIATSEIGDSQVTEAKLNASVAGSGLNGGAGSPLAVNVDSSTIEINSDTLRIKDSGVTPAKLSAPVFGFDVFSKNGSSGTWDDVSGVVTVTGLTANRLLYVAIQPVTGTSIGSLMRFTGQSWVRIINTTDSNVILEAAQGWATSGIGTYSTHTISGIFFSGYTSVSLKVQAKAVTGGYQFGNMQLFVCQV